MIENKKSITMDHVKAEVLGIVENLIIKLQYMADREETLEYTYAADEYMSALTMNDNFYTYRSYSDYALNKAGLTDIRYKNDNSLIPKDKREEVVVYQREYVLANYVEKNNYYRTLAGLPNYGESPLYLKEYVPDVDNSKPLHEMEDDDITILKVTGVLDRLIKENPDKKYLKYLEKDKRIPIYIARQARPYSILYIKRDRTKQGVSDTFISIYNQCSDYIQERFYEESYKHNSPYYDGFIGMFILTTTIQKYITNYFNNFINRDFYDKDIIKLFLESYGIPYFDEIPLSYMQKVAKNLNRLLMYKATDKVFTDIFRIFDIDNIDVNNYILFKDRKLDAEGNPVFKYEEITELGYYVDTDVKQLINNSSFTGEKLLPYTNVKNICMLDATHKVILQNNGILLLEGFRTDQFIQSEIEEKDGIIEYKKDMNIKNLYFYKNPKYTDTDRYIAFLISENFELYFIEPDSFTHFNATTLPNFDTDNEIESVLFAIDQDRTSISGVPSDINLNLSNVNKALVINYKNNAHADVYLSGTVGTYQNVSTSYKLIKSFNDEITNKNIQHIDFSDSALTVTTQQGAVWVVGYNRGDRFMESSTTSPFMKQFTLLENVINVHHTVICNQALIFILNDGLVRYTGYLPYKNLTKTDYREAVIISGLNKISRVRHNKSYGFLEFYEYTNRCVLFITDIQLNNSGLKPVIYDTDVYNPEFKHRYVRDNFFSKLGWITLCYSTTSEIYYAGDNGKRTLPFIKSKKFILANNSTKITDMCFLNNYLYFISKNKLYKYKNSIDTNYVEIPLSISDDIIQKMYSYEDKIYLICGNSKVYIIDNTDHVTSINVTWGGSSNNIIDMNVAFDGAWFINSNFQKVSIDRGIINHSKIINYDTYNYKIQYKTNPQRIVIGNNQYQELFEIYREDTKGSNTYNYFKTITISNPNSSPIITLFQNIFISGNIIIVESDKLYYYNIKEFFKDRRSETSKPILNLNNDSKLTNLFKYSTSSEESIIYNKNGGIILSNDSIMLECFEVDELDRITEYVVLPNEIDEKYIKKIINTGMNIIRLDEKMEVVSYRPVVEDMYNLRFVEVSMDTNSLGEDLSQSANHLDYELVVNDDNLWGGDGDNNSFVREILDSEFNYVYSKYISVNSRYDLTQLNFELCYMFRMLVELKDNEKYMEFDVPYVGKVNLFDCIVGLFALTCLKFGFDGTIMDTTTKTLSVLGFNFQQDMKYIQKVIEDANLHERDPKFKIEDIEIIKAPKLFKESPEIINLYLNNRDVLESVYSYKYNAKTIQEYNAYKRIEFATVVTKYNTDMYRIDGQLPSTYMDYLSRKNINLYEFIKETNPENMVQQIDILLVSLDTFLKTDKLKYLFLNVPSLSMDNIRKFIYYLVDIFKSYTVDLKALNIIYHVDDKRIHNIKMILEEGMFLKKFEDYEKVMIEEFLDYTFSGLKEFDNMKLTCELTPEGNMPLLDFMLFNNKEDFDLEKIHRMYESLKQDFADFFEEMENIIGKEQSINMTHDTLINIVRSVASKKIIDDVEQHSSALDASLLKTNTMQEIEKEYRNGDIYFKSQFIKKFLDNISLTAIRDINEYIKLKELIEYTQISIGLKDLIPFDFNDNIEYIDLINQHDNKINYKERYYFIRKE